ncbi:hypothetical protein UFOVP75_44 [uncultured Caudovirales phage]|uniref:Uncharacterized protein n=1 Tax=uncultured Caudovirales phage TaxID=2100421 RepID=A0A6J5L100_9CAUD|nr:hypothetical protein UFOVP75_44 [uncultured Caudovirales phage]
MPVLDSRILAFQVSNRLTDAPTGTRIELMCRMAQFFKPDVSAEECIEAILAVDTDRRMLAEPYEHLPVARKWWTEIVEHKPNPEVWEGDAMWETPKTHHRLVRRLKQETAPKLHPVCSHCNDTHKMELHDATVMCTRCPIPCRKCQVGGNGPYCTTTPCGCECHGHKTDLRNERGTPIAGDRLSRDSDLDFPKRDR